MFLLAFLKLIPGFFSSLFGKILEYPKTAIAIIAMCCVGIGYMHEEHIINTLKADNAKELTQIDYLQKQTVQLKADVATAVQVNKDDQAVLQQFEVVKLDNVQKAKDLIVLQQKNAVILSSLENLIHSAPKSDDGPVAKVLSETIQSIQNDRKAQ